MDFPSDRFRANSELSTGLLFIRVYNKWHDAIKEELKLAGITHPQFVVLTALNYLSQSEAYVTQVKIAKMAEMDVMTLSQIITGLEKKGYVERLPNPHDSRAKAVHLTDKGQLAVKQALPLVEGIDDRFFGKLGGNEETFQQLLRLLFS